MFVCSYVGYMEAGYALMTIFIFVQSISCNVVVCFVINCANMGGWGQGLWGGVSTNVGTNFNKGLGEKEEKWSIFAMHG